MLLPRSLWGERIRFGTLQGSMKMVNIAVSIIGSVETVKSRNIYPLSK